MDLLSWPASKLMRRDYIGIAPGEPLFEADRLMRIARVRQLPVVAEGRLMGLLGYRDILEYALRPEGSAPADRIALLRGTPVSALMRPADGVATPESPLANVAGVLLRTNLGCVPIVAGGAPPWEILGLVTETDLLRAAYDPFFIWPPA
jgi:CBS domain-containing protein